MYIFLFFVIISIICILVKLVLVPEVHEKILVSNLFTSNAIAAIILLASVIGVEAALDVALVYITVSFVSSVAFLKFFRYKKKHAIDM